MISGGSICFTEGESWDGFEYLTQIVILSQAKDLLFPAPAKSRSFASLKMTIS
jgi:hypothetical protein